MLVGLSGWIDREKRWAPGGACTTEATQPCTPDEWRCRKVVSRHTPCPFSVAHSAPLTFADSEEELPDPVMQSRGRVERRGVVLRLEREGQPERQA